MAQLILMLLIGALSSTIGLGYGYKANPFIFEDDLSSIDDDQSVEIEDRSILDYDARDALPFNTTCALLKTPLKLPMASARQYEISPNNIFNVTCKNADDYVQKFHHTKDYCRIQHQHLREKNLCQTQFEKVPIFFKRKTETEWNVLKVKLGVGCKCKIAIKYQ